MTALDRPAAPGGQTRHEGWNFSTVCRATRMSPLPHAQCSVFLSPPRGYSNRIVSTPTMRRANAYCRYLELVLRPRYQFGQRAPSPPRLRMRRNRRRRLGRLPTAAPLQSSPYLCRLRPPHECGTEADAARVVGEHCGAHQNQRSARRSNGASKSLKHPWAQHPITTRRIINAIPLYANVVAVCPL